MNQFPFLSIITAVPIIGGIVVLAMAGRNRRLAEVLALGSSFLSLALVLLLWRNFDSSSGALQFVEQHRWVPSLGAEYLVGVDGLGILMLLLTALLVPMSLFSSRSLLQLTPLYFACILFLQAGLFGTFTALSFFHWFIFWELSLVPAFFLIRLWGGPDRGSAATQFFVYTMVGSVAMLLGFVALFLATDTFNFQTLAEQARDRIALAHAADRKRTDRLA